MAFTNSFHSSAKSHAIGSASALAGVEAHNERDFFSLRYSADKNHFIVGTAGLSDTVKDFINETFGPHIDAYNEKQRRKDRRITTDAFDYFCANKNLDIAAEAIFQIADQDFWRRWRTDTVIQHRGKEIVRSEYPEHIAATMDEIYRRQIDAYEHIYETHGAEILAKIETHYNRCQDTLDTFRTNPELYERFEKLAEMKAKPRKKALKELSADELEAYDTFQNAYYGVQDIERKQYRERIAAGHLHIKMLQALGHYDEKSPHAHGVSVCWADGYKSGLPSRLAKAVVLNRYTLEVIQDRLHEIAEEEIAKHPEIFGDEVLQEKGTGRNMDFTTEQHVRHQTAQLQREHSRLLGETESLRVQKDILQRQVDDVRASLKTTIQNRDEYNLAIEHLRGPNSPLKAFYDAVHRFARVVKDTTSTREQIVDAAFAMLAPFPPLYQALANVFGYENQTNMPRPERKAPEIADNVDALISGAAARAGGTGPQQRIEQAQSKD